MSLCLRRLGRSSHTTVFFSKHTFIMSTLPDRDPDIHHHIDSVRHI